MQCHSAGTRSLLYWMLWKRTVKDITKSSFQKEVKKEDFHSNERTSSYFCVCAPSAILLWELLFCGTQHPCLAMEAPYFDTAGYSAPLGISGIRGGTPLMIDCLNEKNDHKNPLHEIRPPWMVTGSAHSPQRIIYSPLKWNIRSERFRGKILKMAMKVFPGKDFFTLLP